MNDIKKQFLQQVAYGPPEEIRITLKNYPDLLKNGSFGAAAIHKATENNREDIIPLLAEYGVDIDLPDEYGQTPLMKSVRFRNPALVSSLIRAGANVNFTDSYNQCVLYYAASQVDGKADDIVPLLISSGADATYVDPEGNSPLHIAAFLDSHLR